MFCFCEFKHYWIFKNEFGISENHGHSMCPLYVILIYRFLFFIIKEVVCYDSIIKHFLYVYSMKLRIFMSLWLKLGIVSVKFRVICVTRNKLFGGKELYI